MLEQAEFARPIRCKCLLYKRNVRDRMSANGLKYIQGKDKDSTEDSEKIQGAKPKLGSIPELTAEC